MNKHSKHFTATNLSLTNHEIPPKLLPWLLQKGSLTSQLEQLSGCPLHVNPTFEGFRYIDTATSQLLKLPKRQMAWVREVALYGNEEKPWAIATSSFPISAIKGPARRLRYLGNTPLGYVLFSRHKPTCKRIITSRMVDNILCYTRQNLYLWHGHTILVEETFLPAFLKRIGT